MRDALILDEGLNADVGECDDKVIVIGVRRGALLPRLFDERVRLSFEFLQPLGDRLLPDVRRDERAQHRG